jgi:membrane-associated phospholipid phosphatase
VGLPLAAATGYLRVAADRHYFTDVVGGMLVGAIVGVGIPLLFHRPMSERVVLGSAAVPGGQVFSLTLPSPI